MIFLDIQNNLRIRDSGGYGGGGVKFWSRDFWGVLIFAPIRSSLSLEIQSTSPGFELRSDGYPTRVKF